MAINFEELKSEYSGLWQRMQVRPERAGQVDSIARRLIGFKARYEGVSRTTGVPWAVIAVLHQRESTANFNTHLHNGDSLNARTHHVPAGRPATGSPPFGWEASAADALMMPPHSLNAIHDWSIERTCFEIEKYNGFGYRRHHPSVKSPYLWSFSTNYDRGKYTGDGHFDPGAVDQQCGTMPVLKRIMELDASVRFDGSPVVVSPPVSDDSLAIGAVGDRVRQLQEDLAQLGFQVGEIDGELGPITAAAVSAFQSARGLPATGVADQATQRALAAAVGAPMAGPSDTMTQVDVLGALFEAIRTRAPAPGPTPGQPGDGANVLHAILAALMARPLPSAPGQAAQPGQGANAPILSPIDRALGGEALAGKKTALSVVAYVVLAILQAVGVVGAATPTGQILTTLIAAFGALGGVSKVDRVVQALGVIAARRPQA